MVLVKMLAKSSLPFLVSACVVFTACSVHAADPEPATNHSEPESLVGTWVLSKAEVEGSPSGIGTRLKIYNKTHWVMVQPVSDTGKVVFLHGGTYEFDGSTLKETIDFAGDATLGGVGSTSEYRIVFRGQQFEQIDPRGVWNEVWKRVKPNGEK